MAKTILGMKLTLVLLVAAFLNVSATGVSQTVTYSARDVPIEKVFSVIKEQTGFVFFYNGEMLKTTKPVTVNANNISLKKFLEQVFSGQPLKYTIKNRSIIIGLKPIAHEPKSDYLKDWFIPITGTVKDGSGAPLAGATVKVKGKEVTVVTNEQGAFSLNANIGDVLLVSYVGFQQKEIKINTASPYSISLQNEEKEIEQVVVTALGIKRKTKSLAYNVQEVKGEELTRNKDASFVNSLVGKVAGVTINASAAGVGGATRVVMRGPKSINYNNNALYVVDGIPLTTDMSTDGKTRSGQLEGLFGGATQSDGISNINPDDIESLSVLTGAAAAALYGSLGQNGVVVITTKSGAVGKTRLSLSNNTSFFDPFVMPRFQNEYGQSEEGSFYSWGPKLIEPGSYKPADFFQTGSNVTNSMTFSTGTEKNQTFLSGAVLNGKGIIPNNKITRYNFTVRNTSRFLNDKLSMDINLMYIRQNEQNMFAQGLYHSPIVPVYLFPPGANIKTYQAFERFDATRFFPTQFWPFSDDQFRMQNPYWITNREFFVKDINRILLGVNLKYNLYDWLNITTCAKIERNSTVPTTKFYASTNQLFAGAGGRFGTGDITTEQQYLDVIANFNKPIGDFAITGNLGYSRIDNKSKSVLTDSYIPEGAVPNLFNTGNAPGSVIALEPSHTSFQAVFANAELSYKNMLFLSGTLRNDWWSQLFGTGKLYVTYPSAGASVIASDLFHLKSDIVSFVKLRANYSTVGNPPPPYVTGQQTYPVENGSPNFSNGIRPSETLQPERTKAWEAGVNVRLFHNKVNLDFTVYNTNTYNQIFNVPISTSSFYSSYYINAGQVNNKGIEASIGYTGKIGRVNWEANATFTLNRNKIVHLINNYYDDLSGLYITRDTLEMGGAGSYSMKARTNGSLNDIYTSTLALDEHNDFIIRSNVAANPANTVYAGMASPDYTIGLRNGFAYKNFNLNFVLFGRFGGVGVSATQAMMDAFGVSETSAQARDKGYVLVNGAKYSGVQDYYTVMGNGINGVLSQYVYSATNIRVKELSFGYTIPAKVFKGFIQGLSLSATAQNLFMFYNKAPFDPENTASTGTYYQGIDYFMQPSLRSFGFSVKAQL